MILILTSAACLSFQLELWMAAALHPSLACATGWELYAGRYYQTGTFDSFVCKKKKKLGDFGSHHITEIFHCLALVFRSLDADWQLNKPCCRVEAFLHFCLPSLLCEAAADPICLLGSGAAVPLPWPGVRGQAGEEKWLTEALEWTNCQTQHNLCRWPFYVCFIICIFLSSRVYICRDDDVGDGQA